MRRELGGFSLRIPATDTRLTACSSVVEGVTHTTHKPSPTRYSPRYSLLTPHLHFTLSYCYCTSQVNNPPIPNWAKAARFVFALTCTSAASERVFSLVKAMFGKANDRILADGVQGSVMLRYNKRMVG